MQTVVVEPRDPFDDCQLKLQARPPDAVGDQLGLEGVDELSAIALSSASPTLPITR